MSFNRNHIVHKQKTAIRRDLMLFGYTVGYKAMVHHSVGYLG
jgi:hypothetical protein